MSSSSNRFVESFSKLPFSGKHAWVRPWYLNGREAALKGNDRQRDAASVKLGVLALVHAFQGALGVKFGLDNLNKQTTIGNIAAGYDGLYALTTASAAYVQFYLSHKLHNTRPCEAGHNKIEEAPTPPSPIVELGITESKYYGISDVPARELIRDTAITYGAQILFIVTAITSK